MFCTSFNGGPGALEDLAKGLCARGYAPVKLTQDNAPELAVLADHARALDGCRKPGGAAYEVLRPHHRTDPLRSVHPVLKRNDDGVPTHQGFDQLGCIIRVIGLGRKHHQFDRPHLGRLIGDLRRQDPEVAKDTLDLQSLVANGGKMRPSCDKGHLMPSLREQSPVIATDPTRTHDGNSHKAPFFSFSCHTESILLMPGKLNDGHSHNGNLQVLTSCSQTFAFPFSPPQRWHLGQK